jgi:hypothetical protein
MESSKEGTREPNPEVALDGGVKFKDRSVNKSKLVELKNGVVADVVEDVVEDVLINGVVEDVLVDSVVFV